MRNSKQSTDTSVKTARQVDVLRIEQKGELSGDDVERSGVKLFDLEKGYRYSLVIRIQASFISPSFATIPYLRSVSELELIDPLDGNFECSIEASLNSSSVDWTVLLKFAKRPHSSFALTFAAGPHRWAVPLGGMKWSEYQGEENIWDPKSTQWRPKRWAWWGAHASSAIRLKDPDWALLSSTRLFSTAILRLR